MLHRISLMAAVVIAALAISVTPALAGEDDGNPATPPVTTTPAPAPPPAPAPVVEIPPSVQRDLDRLQNEVDQLKEEASNESESGGGGGGGNSGASNTANTTPVATTPVAETFTVPQGGVQAGAGGTAPQGSADSLQVGLGIAGLALALAAGGFVLRRRYITE